MHIFIGSSAGLPARGLAAGLGWFAMVCLVCGLMPAPGLAWAAQTACSDTAQAMVQACRNEVDDDYRSGLAACLNEADPDRQSDCQDEVAEERADGIGDCRDQKQARLEACELLGEAPYDPSFAPADFETDFVTPAVSNPYLPLKVGNHWAYASEEETNEVQVLARTKSIEGVTCVVVRDTVAADGVVAEDTEDWIAQASSGVVWYCGELSKELEVNEDDAPPLPELVDIEGSFKAGRDRAKPGVLMPAILETGAAYRQEFDLGNAEDIAQVVSVTYRHGDDPGLDVLVPAGLADLLCAQGDCLVTREFSPLEPEVEEFKYYAPGVGLFLETNPADGERLQLVSCNVDPRCSNLPAP